jgi:hypothetical protein
MLLVVGGRCALAAKLAAVAHLLAVRSQAFLVSN